MSEKQIYAGIDIGGSSIKYGLVDRKGKVLFREQRPTMAEKGAEPLLHLVGNIAESLLYHAAEDDLEVGCLGVGTPGAVDCKTGKVIGLSPNIEGWQGTEIGRTLSERLNLPVWVDNDVNAMALAESRFGAGVGYRSMICVAVGTGVGGGIVLDGRLWRGGNHSAGEIGHVSINIEGPRCRCGNNGCIEAYCSSAAIIRRANSKLQGALTPILSDILEGDIDTLNIKKLFAAARKNDPVALEVVQETAELLARGLAGVVNLLNPDLVVIGGGVADGGAGFIEGVAAGIKKQAFASATDNLCVTGATLGNNAGFIGSGLLGEMRQIADR